MNPWRVELDEPGDHGGARGGADEDEHRVGGQGPSRVGILDLDGLEPVDLHAA
jgi:hypothetical protein